VIDRGGSCLPRSVIEILQQLSAGNRVTSEQLWVFVKSTRLGSWNNDGLSGESESSSTVFSTVIVLPGVPFVAASLLVNFDLTANPVGNGPV
jgi:hypothetical protein